MEFEPRSGGCRVDGAEAVHRVARFRTPCHVGSGTGPMRTDTEAGGRY
jgi:hypothetical protein